MADPTIKWSQHACNILNWTFVLSTDGFLDRKLLDCGKDFAFHSDFCVIWRVEQFLLVSFVGLGREIL